MISGSVSVTLSVNGASHVIKIDRFLVVADKSLTALSKPKFNF